MTLGVLAGVPAGGEAGVLAKPVWPAKHSFILHKEEFEAVLQVVMAHKYQQRQDVLGVHPKRGLLKSSRGDLHDYMNTGTTRSGIFNKVVREARREWAAKRMVQPGN